MKTILAVLIALMFVACSSVETDNLKKENTDLKSQLETITKERDALKVQLDSIKAVLENAAGNTSITPDSSASTPTAPDSSNSTPDSNMNSGNSSADSSIAATATAPSGTPSSDGSNATTPDSSASASTPISAVEMYAKSVLETAKKYNSETQQTPPTDCSSGYTAGTHAVPSSDAVQSCRVDRIDTGFRVTLKDANGAITTLPTP